MSAACQVCQDTGHLPGSAYLDCTHCETATQRVMLETWAKEQGIRIDPDQLWAVFRKGQESAGEPKLLYRGHSPSTSGNRIAKIWMDEVDESREYMRAQEARPLPAEPEQQMTRLDILSLIHSQMHLAFVCGQEDRQVDNMYMGRIETALRAMKP